MEYSKDINALLGSSKSTPASVFEDPKAVLKVCSIFFFPVNVVSLKANCNLRFEIAEK